MLASIFLSVVTPVSLNGFAVLICSVVADSPQGVVARKELIFIVLALASSSNLRLLNDCVSPFLMMSTSATSACPILIGKGGLMRSGRPLSLVLSELFKPSPTVIISRLARIFSTTKFPSPNGESCQLASNFSNLI